MKKFSVLVGAIGSTAAWYVLSNKKLRNELGKAKTPEETIKILTGYLGRDASKIGAAVHDWIHSEELHEKVESAKELSKKTFSGMKKGFGDLLEQGKKAADVAMDAARSDDKVAAAKEVSKKAFSGFRKGFGGLLDQGKKAADVAMEKAKGMMEKK